MKTAIVGLVLCLGACVSPPSGPGAGATMTGTVTSSQGGDLGSVTVTVTPTGSSALPTVQTASDGTYTVDHVPVGDGSVTVSGMPGNCAPTATVQYTGLKNGGHRIINLIVGCN